MGKQVASHIVTGTKRVYYIVHSKAFVGCVHFGNVSARAVFIASRCVRKCTKRVVCALSLTCWRLYKDQCEKMYSPAYTGFWLRDARTGQPFNELAHLAQLLPCPPSQNTFNLLQDQSSRQVL